MSAARVRGTSCKKGDCVCGPRNKEHEIRIYLKDALKRAEGVVFEVIHKGANFVVKLHATGKRVIPQEIMYMVSQAITQITVMLGLHRHGHKCDGRTIIYKLAEG